MKRWNGWGDTTKHFPVPVSAVAFLAKTVGEGIITPDALIEQALQSVPESRLIPSSGILTDPMDRLLHARGQSLPDWIALRSGAVQPFPDGVAYPESAEAVRSLLEFSAKNRTVLIPYGAGSSVVGHINPVDGDRPILVVDMGKLHHLVSLDPVSQIAVMEAGILGPDLEAALSRQGFTFGHFPQSFEFSSLGGWIATRSSGQQSYYYGRIEDQFLGGEVETFQGKVSISPYPASAAGPDIKHLVLGSEGKLGIITRAAIRIHPIPEAETFKAVFFHDWDTGAEVVRQIAQKRIPVSMLRLSDEIETQTTLLLSGKEKIVSYAQRGLNAAGYKGQRSLLIFGATGSSNSVNRTVRHVYDISLRQHGLPVPFMIGKLWQKTRFFTPYLRNTLWENGYALDTLETVLPWEKVVRVARKVRNLLEGGLGEEDERVLAFAHLSHVYQVGASFYITYLFRRSPDPEHTLQRWKILKSAASHAILAEGGTISHQHGVGVDHSAFLSQERGRPFVKALHSALHTFDPMGLLNPGKLIPAEEEEAYDVETRLA